METHKFVALARIHTEAGRFEEARAMLEKARQLDETLDSVAEIEAQIAAGQ